MKSRDLATRVSNLITPFGIAGASPGIAPDLQMFFGEFAGI
jgi:hypothetical protein